jgi:hypothetical protein
MIARRDAISYYPFNPVILPSGIRPVPAKTMLSIGEYKKPETGKRKRHKTVDEFRNDGTLGDSQEDEFTRRYLHPLRKNDQSDASILSEWMHSRKRLTESKYTPLQTMLTTSQISHSFRTVQFVSLVSKMERRILQRLHGHSQDKSNPDDFEDFSGTAPSSTLLIPRRKKNLKSMDDSGPDLISVPAVQAAEPATLSSVQTQQGESPYYNMEIADEFLQDEIIMASDISLQHSPLLSRIVDTSIPTATEESQEGVHEKPSFVFISPEESGIFGKHLVESPIKPTTRPRPQEATRLSTSDTNKVVNEVQSDTKFAFNDYIVPVYDFEMENNINSVPTVASNWRTSLPRAIQYSTNGHQVLLKRWSAISNQDDNALVALQEALQGVLAKGYKPSGRTYAMQKQGMLYVDMEYDDDMDFEYNDDNYSHKDNDSVLSAKYAGISESKEETKNREAHTQFFHNGDDFLDDIYDLEYVTSDEGNGNIIGRCNNESESRAQPTQVAINGAGANKPESTKLDSQPKSTYRVGNVSESDEDCLEFDFGELDLTILENKLDLEGGYTPAERSPPLSSVQNYPDIITLSSESDASVNNDIFRRDERVVSNQHPDIAASQQASMKAEPVSIKQSQTMKKVAEERANSADISEDASLVMDALEHGNPLSNLDTSSQKTSPIKFKNSAAQRRQRVLYSSQTEDASSSPIRPTHTTTLKVTDSNSACSVTKGRLHNGSQFRKRNPFLDLEASESGEGVSSDIEDDLRSSFMDSFIDDNTIGSSSITNSPNANRSHSTNMYAVYRQSLMSPEQTGNNGSNNIFNHTNRPRYLQRVLENLDYVEEEEEEDSLDLTEPSEHTENLIATDEPASRNSQTSNSVHFANSYDSDFM